ncbi:hypothetical protein Bequi_09810 [Brachybacterium sp. JHP9]|uniref:Uncharacterized protein n=1 Tax=Brachybacterium equifaecis TaxID=2910770 RepID=A0ABT0R2I5_9MICO|nr:hypothetical protein [Brachybacterium equifaecis]MCL6423678.1 hypothetical protein [Brachybacterium equifaecis]
MTTTSTRPRPAPELSASDLQAAFPDLEPLGISHIIAAPSRIGREETDEAGSKIALALRQGRISDAQAREMVNVLVESTLCVNTSLNRTYRGILERHPLEIPARVRERIKRKVSDPKFFDIARIENESLATWVSAMARMVCYDVLRSMKTSGELNTVSIYPDASHPGLGDGGGGKSPLERKDFDAWNETRSEQEDLEQRIDLLHQAEDESLTEDGSKPRRITPTARLHIMGEYLRRMGSRPPVIIPFVWEERDEVHRLLLADPSLARRSLLDPSASDIPVALAAMWDNYSADDRYELAAAADRAGGAEAGARLDHAYLIALSAVSPFPRPHHMRVFTAFRERVRDLHSSTAWRKASRQVANAWIGVFVDLETVQDRAVEKTKLARLEAAEEGRALWDQMVQGRLTEPVSQIARTPADLVDVLSRLWHLAQTEDATAPASSFPGHVGRS